MASFAHLAAGLFLPAEQPPAPEPLLTPQPGTGGADISNEIIPNRGSELAPPMSGGADSVLPAFSHWTLAEWLGYGALLLVSLALTAVALTTLWWMLHAWWSRENLTKSRFTTEPLDPTRSFTLLVPGRHEEEVMGATLDQLALQDHPDFEIIAIVGHDDPGTELVCREAAARHPDLIRVVVDHSVPKNKPKALNTALKTARGEVVGVFDAEDEVHPQLLRLVDSRFSETGADVVQGGVQLMNFETTWWSLRNVLEYYFWFRSRLHFHADANFIPLGGNTVFVTRDWLDWSNGWDANCLAEDCELGVRMSSAGAKVAVAYSPEVVTREETPGTLKSLFKQRTRWNQGFLQVLRKGEWKKLPTRSQRMFARYMLAMPFLQAFTGAIIPVSICLILFAKVPAWVAMVSFLPLAPTIITLSVEIAALQEFGKLYGKKVRVRDYLRLILGTIPYQIFLAAAAVRSVYRQIRGDNSWEKTEHTGAHRDPNVVLEAAPANRDLQPTGAQG